MVRSKGVGVITEADEAEMDTVEEEGEEIIGVGKIRATVGFTAIEVVDTVDISISEKTE